MKFMIVIQMLFTLTAATRAGAVVIKKSAGPQLQVACVAKLKAQKAAGQLRLQVPIEDFCECLADNHVEQARQAANKKMAAQYLEEVNSYYSTFDMKEAEARRAAHSMSDGMDSEIQVGCDKK